MRLLWPILLLALSACTSTAVLRDEEYQRTVTAFRLGDIETSFEQFPEKEKGGFITNVEKSWIGLWRADWQAGPLLKHGDSFDQRKYIRISREAGYFFTAESEEGYMPSEPEHAILHLLAAAHLIKQDRIEAARVELRRTDEVLSMAFDDPALRLWAAAMWGAIGEWDEARVDLRRVHELNGNKEALKLANGKQPPEIVLHFYGVGPELKWESGSFAPKFIFTPTAPTGPLVVSTKPWFDRHLKRNSELRDLMVSSNYMAQYVGGEAVEATETVTLGAAAVALKTTAVAVGTVLAAGAIAILSEGGSGAGEAAGWLLGAAFGTGAYIWGGAEDMHKSGMRTIKQDSERRERELRIYRLVRFMPEYIELSKVGACASCKSVTMSLPGAKTVVTLVHHL